MVPEPGLAPARLSQCSTRKLGWGLSKMTLVSTQDSSSLAADGDSGE
jgi:hypothetical protein